MSKPLNVDAFKQNTIANEQGNRIGSYWPCGTLPSIGTLPKTSLSSTNSNKRQAWLHMTIELNQKWDKRKKVIIVVELLSILG